MKKKLLSLFMTTAMSVVVLAGCGSAQSETATEAVTAETASEDAENVSEDEAVDTTETEAIKPATDRSGNEITVPEEVNTIVSMAPSTTQVLIDLGLADKIIAIDTNSGYQFADTFGEDIPQFDMMAPDNEQLAALAPDLVFTSGMSGADTFDAVKAAGICVADIPSSASIADIEEDLQFIGDCVGASDDAAAIVEDMEVQLKKYDELAATISDDEQKTVLYEVSTPTADYPTIYSAGQNTYIDEMITRIGAVNAAGGESDQWPALSEEAAIALNPDVILTSDSWTPDVVNTLLGLSGWENVTAIASSQVYLLDANRINQPNQHILEAMKEIAQYVYPDVYTDEALQ